MKQTENKEGVALIMILMIIVILIGMLGLSMQHNARVNGLLAVRSTVDEKLYWVAQQALENAEVNFLSENFGGFSGKEGDVAFATSVDGSYGGSADYKVVSTAVFGEQSVSLQEYFAYTPPVYDSASGSSFLRSLGIMPNFNKRNSSSDYGIYATSSLTIKPSSDFDKVATVFGGIFYYKGTSFPDMELYATHDGWENNSWDAKNDPNEPDITILPDNDSYDYDAMEVIYDQMDIYDQVVASAVDSSAKAISYNANKKTKIKIKKGETIYIESSGNNADLAVSGNGGTLVIRSNYFRPGAPLDIGAGVRLIVTGDFVINNTISLNNKVDVYAGGKLIFNNTSDKMSNSGKHLLYSAAGITINGNPALPKYSGEFMTRGDINIAGETQFDKTFMFSDGVIKNTSPMDFTGSLFAHQFFCQATTTLTLDKKKSYPDWLELVSDGGAGGSAEEVLITPASVTRTELRRVTL